MSAVASAVIGKALPVGKTALLAGAVIATVGSPTTVKVKGADTEVVPKLVIASAWSVYDPGVSVPKTELNGLNGACAVVPSPVARLR